MVGHQHKPSTIDIRTKLFNFKGIAYNSSVVVQITSAFPRFVDAYKIGKSPPIITCLKTAPTA